ncbi:MAG TPA: hypothetical protein PLR74_04065 [Agriterribacter sp.]|nr:hypothetical protein [Agriterribacter sp.]
MNISGWIIIVVFIVALFFINRFLNRKYLSKTAPEKVEVVRLIGLAFLLGVFYFKAFEDARGIGFQIALAILTAYLIYRSYRLIKGMSSEKA